MRAWPVLFASALTLAWAGGAHAEGPAADALFEQGRKALAAGDLDTACARFRASDQIEPAAGTKANLADCEERRGNVATAWELNRSALNNLPDRDPRSAPLKRRIAKLEPRLPKLVLKLADGAPPETMVKEGAAILGAAGGYDVPLPLDPGVHHIAISAPGRPGKTIDVMLSEGKTQTVTVEPGSAEGLGESARASKSRAQTAPSASGGVISKKRADESMMVSGVLITAGAIASTVIGALLLFSAQDAVIYDGTITGPSDAQKRFQVGLIMVPLGAVLPALGVPLWVNGAKDAPSSGSLIPTVVPGSRSVALRWTM
jgi:hypothetical protein